MQRSYGLTFKYHIFVESIRLNCDISAESYSLISNKYLFQKSVLPVLQLPLVHLELGQGRDELDDLSLHHLAGGVVLLEEGGHVHDVNLKNDWSGSHQLPSHLLPVHDVDVLEPLGELLGRESLALVRDDLPAPGRIQLGVGDTLSRLS